MIYDVRKNPDLIGAVRVTVDGRDVTRECFRANTGAGKAHCYVRGENGGFRISGDKLAETVLRGHVAVEVK